MFFSLMLRFQRLGEVPIRSSVMAKGGENVPGMRMSEGTEDLRELSEDQDTSRSVREEQKGTQGPSRKRRKSVLSTGGSSKEAGSFLDHIHERHNPSNRTAYTGTKRIEDLPPPGPSLSVLRFLGLPYSPTPTIASKHPIAPCPIGIRPDTPGVLRPRSVTCRIRLGSSDSWATAR